MTWNEEVDVNDQTKGSGSISFRSCLMVSCQISSENEEDAIEV